MQGVEVSELCDRFDLEFLEFDYDSFIDQLCLNLFYAEEFPAKLIEDTDKELSAKKKEVEDIKAKQTQWQKQLEQVLDLRAVRLVSFRSARAPELKICSSLKPDLLYIPARLSPPASGRVYRQSTVPSVT